MKRIWTVDFETDAIKSFPDYPPAPVGVSVRIPEGQSVYLAWGHPTENNATKQMGYELVKRAYDSGDQLLFHSANFDTEVAREHFDLPIPHPTRIEDTLYHLFLNDPLASTLSLKPSAERLLHIPPDEQQAVRQWLIDHHVVPSNMKEWGAYLSKAPGDLVGAYAIGDVDRTKALYDFLYPQTESKGMTLAYNRERFLAPILVRNTREGIRVDLDRLRTDYQMYWEVYEKITKEITKALKVGPDFNLDSGAELADALRVAGKVVADELWPKTPTGKLSTAREVLGQIIADRKLFVKIAYRGALKSCLTTFFAKWLAQAEVCDGRVHPSWNSVRGDNGGTRTGRLSCYDPNFQNVPTEFDEEVPPGYPPLPLMRSYILPDEGEVFVSADFHSQEIRGLGHYAEGAIQRIYQDDPTADIHAVAGALIKETTGIEMTRKAVKIIAFSILYGAGNKKLAQSLGVDMQEAAKMKRAYLNVLTGVEELQDEVEARARSGVGVRSWGGRLLQAPPSEVRENGGIWDRSYVLINYLIQGSAADQTKEAIIRYDERHEHGRFLVTVHDEICISVRKAKLKAELKHLLWAMEEQPGWDVPYRSEVKVGLNWQAMEAV